MIIVDDAYAAASERSMVWAKRLLLGRFQAVFGHDGEKILSEMEKRMQENIESDNRSR